MARKNTKRRSWLLLILRKVLRCVQIFRSGICESFFRSTCVFRLTCWLVGADASVYLFSFWAWPVDSGLGNWIGVLVDCFIIDPIIAWPIEELSKRTNQCPKRPLFLFVVRRLSFSYLLCCLLGISLKTVPVSTLPSFQLHCRRYVGRARASPCAMMTWDKCGDGGRRQRKRTQKNGWQDGQCDDIRFGMQ